MEKTIMDYNVKGQVHPQSYNLDFLDDKVEVKLVDFKST